MRLNIDASCSLSRSAIIGIFEHFIGIRNVAPVANSSRTRTLLNMGPRRKSIRLKKVDVEMLTQMGFRLEKPLSAGEFGVVYLAWRKKPKEETEEAEERTHEDEEEGEHKKEDKEKKDKDDKDHQEKSKSQSEEEEEKIAAKVIDLSRLSQEQIEKDLMREIFMMNRIKHPHVVDVYDMVYVSNYFIVFMEFAEGGDLCDYISENRTWLKEPIASRFYQQFGSALRYMHHIGFAHRDVKLENVLLNGDQTVTKLTDFGFSRGLYDPVTGKRVLSDTWCGTVAYMAPEILAYKEAYCPMKADVWSMGVCLFHMLHNDFPFGDEDEKAMVEQQQARNYRHFNSRLSRVARDLIDAHLEPNPVERPTMDRIFLSEWLDPDYWQ